LNFKKNSNYFREIDHTADIGLEINGDTIPFLFANAAFGFYQLLFETNNIPVVHEKEIVLEDHSLNDLFVRWLSELNYLLTVEQFVMSEIQTLSVKKTKNNFELYAKLNGNTDILYQTTARFEIKAVTYHQLKIVKKKSGFQTRIYFDI